MLYRKFGKTNEEVSILGFGCMRFPTVDEDTKNIDEEKSIEMVRYAIDNGVNYIDTAYPYHGGMSEPLVGKALQDGYREKVYLATKLPSWLIKTREDMDKYLNEQLEKLQTDYIDFYLVHALNKDFWSNLTNNGIFEFLDSAIKSGKIKYAGFSFHDNVDLFKEIVDSYNWTFTQIQYNYLDTDYQAGLEGLDYAYDKGLAVVIMEPLRGGKLVNNIPNDIKALWDTADTKRNPVEWALKYIWDNPKVSAVLSGMSTLEQVKENIELSNDGNENSLTKDEKSLIKNVSESYKSKIKVDCTDCKYCMPCPSSVNIPRCFSIYNNGHMFNDVENAKKIYNKHMNEENKASACTECGKCEEACPQNIEIIDKLKEVVEAFKK